MIIKKKKFKEITEEWFILQKEQVKESTYATYNHHIEKHIKPYFKNKCINKISHNDIQKFINFKLKNGRLNGNGGLSIKTVKELTNIIKLIFKYSIDNGYIDTINLNFKLPLQKKTIHMINDEEFIRLSGFLKIKSDPFYAGLLLMLCTGIRIGELCALKNNDISIINQEISINKTLQRIQDIDNNSTKVIISTTKTFNSTRTIPIPNSLIPYIKVTNRDNYFLTQTLKYIEPRVFEYKFKKIIKMLEIREVTVHSLRHYFASRCIELGFDYNCLSEILGHASPSTTMNLYVHSKDNYKQECMNKVDI